MRIIKERISNRNNIKEHMELSMAKIISTLIIVISVMGNALGQNTYQYSINLNEVKDDQLKVELVTPKVTKPSITFFLPKIIPGTYGNADYGKFVHEFKALDKSGKEIPVKQLTDNSWKIEKATKLHMITYMVEDTWESNISHYIYDMAGTNIEAGKNYVINTPGFFGYFEDMKELPFNLTIQKPSELYGSTPLIATSSDKNTDTFTLEDADHLYDSPIMYCVPDTTTLRLGATEVLISVYSPRKLVTSKAISGLLKDMLTATQSYLGGKLPVNKYAFIYYFNGEQPPLKRTGALEHNYSSFYALPELEFEKLAPTLFDISAHEFFHVVTPLTISSQEVKEFNFNEPVLSKHLWLYEGTTEYHSDHVQVVEGLVSPEEFLAKLGEKISISRKDYNDNLSFTELSKQSAGTHQKQYGNVYEKGALISACLDIYLLHLSKGKYDLIDLKHDLSIKYGKDKYFKDDELFDEISRLTFPEVRDFFTKYVEGSTPIPYEKFFEMAGVNFIVSKTPSLGNVQLGGTPEGKLVVAGTESLNEFGKQLGYKAGDEFVSINGTPITLQNAQEVLDAFKQKTKEGEKISIVVSRKNESGEIQTLTLSGTALMIEVAKLEINDSAKPNQIQVRNAWLGKSSETTATQPTVNADPKDVADIDSVVKSLYGIISGPAGERNWDRFRSLFYSGAYMGAMVKTPNGKQLKKFSPEEYVKSNGPFFKQYGFHEEEINRVTNTFGDIAQVFTTYAFALEMPQVVKQRGINSIELIRENGRWWIMSIIWDEESDDNPIPKQYLSPTTAKKSK